MPITQAFYDQLSEDATLTGLLASYAGGPAVFTTDPAPGDATMPYIVAAGEVTASAWDTKTTLGRRIMRDVRCYAEADGSVDVVEGIAERVRELFHRQALEIEGFGVVIAEAGGPVKADEEGAYGRIVTVRLAMIEDA